MVLIALGGGTQVGPAAAALAAAVAVAAAAGGLLLAQRQGLLRLFERAMGLLPSRLAAPALGELAGLHDEAMAIYGDRRAMVRAMLWHLATWGFDAVELWIVFWILGVRLTVGEALVIESLAQAIRSGAFLVPGALGVQEGAYVLLALHFGIGADTAIAASLVKRVRDLALGVPVILGWQALEGRRLLGSRTDG